MVCHKLWSVFAPRGKFWGIRNVGVTYVSPAIFDGRSFQQLHAERNKIANNVSKLTADQKKVATGLADG